MILHGNPIKPALHARFRPLGTRAATLARALRLSGPARENPKSALSAESAYWQACRVQCHSPTPFMPTDVKQTIHTNVARLAAADAGAAQVADAAVATWRNVDAALSPIIGPRGVRALYERSIHVTRAAHPCIEPTQEAGVQPGEFAALHAALAQQTSANAAAANGALLQAFCDLLTILIGASLTEQLLRTVWDPSSTGDSAQDTTK